MSRNHFSSNHVKVCGSADYRGTKKIFAKVNSGYHAPRRYFTRVFGELVELTREQAMEVSKSVDIIME